MKSVDLTHHFLIAMPAMTDPYFAKTLTYICEHNEQGALGIVLNRRIDLDFQALFEQINIPLENQALAAHADALRRAGADGPGIRAAPAGGRLAVEPAWCRTISR